MRSGSNERVVHNSPPNGYSNVAVPVAQVQPSIPELRYWENSKVLALEKEEYFPALVALEIIIELSSGSNPEALNALKEQKEKLHQQLFSRSQLLARQTSTTLLAQTEAEYLKLAGFEFFRVISSERECFFLMPAFVASALVDYGAFLEESKTISPLRFWQLARHACSKILRYEGIYPNYRSVYNTVLSRIPERRQHVYQQDPYRRGTFFFSSKGDKFKKYEQFFAEPRSSTAPTLV